MIWPGILSSQHTEQPPAFCSITLSGDLAPSFGALPADVDGRIVYIENKTAPAAGEDGYLALETPGDTKPLYPEERVVEIHHNDKVAGVAPSLIAVSGDLATVVVASIGVSGDVLIWIESPPGTQIPETAFQISPSGTWPETIALSIEGSTGNVDIFVDGVSQNLSVAHPEYAGVFSGQSTVGVAINIGVQNSAVSPVSMQLPVSVAGSTMVSTYPPGLRDWCNEPLP